MAETLLRWTSLLFEWLFENRQWVFDGFGVAIVGALLVGLRRLFTTAAAKRKKLADTDIRPTASRSINTNAPIFDARSDEASSRKMRQLV
jgi:hypothetical protein